LDRPLVQAGAAITTFLILGAASILLTNALFSVMASGKPSVTFSIATATPAAVTMSATPTPAKPAVDVRIARRPY